MIHKASSEDILSHTYCQEKEGQAFNKGPKGGGSCWQRWKVSLRKGPVCYTNSLLTRTGKKPLYKH